MDVTLTLHIAQTAPSYAPIPDAWVGPLHDLGAQNGIDVPPLFEQTPGTWSATATVVTSDIGPPPGTIGRGEDANSWQVALSQALSGLGYS